MPALFGEVSARTSDFAALGEYGITGIVLGSIICLAAVVLIVIGGNFWLKRVELQESGASKKEIAESQRYFVDAVKELAVGLGVTTSKVDDHEKRICKLEDENERD